MLKWEEWVHVLTHSGPRAGAELSPEPSSPAAQGPSWLTRAAAAAGPPSTAPCSQAPGCGALRPDWSLGVSEGVRPWLRAALSVSLATSRWRGGASQEPLSVSSSENPSGGDGLREVSAGSWPACAPGHGLPTPSRNGVRTTQRAGGGEQRKRVAPLRSLRWPQGRQGACGAQGPSWAQTAPGWALYPPLGREHQNFCFLGHHSLEKSRGRG